MNLSRRFIPTLLLSFTLALIFTACNNREEVEIPVFSDRYKHFVETLSSDNFEGRAPTTPGGKKTKAFIEAEFRRMGLKPANNGSFRQSVPLVEITGRNFSALTIADTINELSFSYFDQMMVGSSQLTDSIYLDKSELVFAGYGIVAPEYNWNDYKGLDVKGKTVIVLVNDPGYELKDDNLFNGFAMTYYGRWTYKYEEAARQGAAGVLIIHETGPAGYGWDVVKNSWSGPQYKMGGNNGEPAAQVEGWLHKESAEALMELAGFELEDLKQRALNQDFEPIDLDLKASVNFNLTYIESESANIAGYVKGSKYPDETVIYMAHWDHLGKTVTDDDEVRIYNGAIDNATGTAAIMVIAKKFAQMNPAPERTVVFIAVTAEESGLIGSQYYSLNPLFPLETTAGGINIDGLNVYGPTRDIVVIGYGSTDFQNILKQQADKQNRVLIRERYPERGYFYRSDHFNFVKQGVPMIYANSGTDFSGRNERFAEQVLEDQESRYHSTEDIIHDMWDWKGLDQNLWLFFNTGKELANSRKWPQWEEGTEFRAIREESSDLRED